MLRIGSIVINCNDSEKTIAFWQEALHYSPRRIPLEGGPHAWNILKDPSGTSPSISVQATDELKFGRNRMHLDLYADDRTAEVERLVRLGATVVQAAADGRDFTILADPEGKRFCVVQV